MPALALPHLASDAADLSFPGFGMEGNPILRAEIPSPQRHLFARPGQRSELPETAGKFQAAIIITLRTRLCIH